jgi:hypothetical protein
VIVGAAFCPHPPALIPLLGVGLTPELGILRQYCAKAIRQICDLSPDRIVVLGTADVGSADTGIGAGQLNRYGVDAEAGRGMPERGDEGGSPPLPLSLTVGLWLLEQAGTHTTEITVEAVTADMVSEGPTMTSPDRLGLVVMGDGSARRSERAPGYLDARAAPFDATVLRALRSGDPAALASLDGATGAELLAAGVPAWRRAGAVLSGSRYHSEVTYADDPFGVYYTVAFWSPRVSVPAKIA